MRRTWLVSLGQGRCLSYRMVPKGLPFSILWGQSWAGNTFRHLPELSRMRLVPVIDFWRLLLMRSLKLGLFGKSSSRVSRRGFLAISHLFCSRVALEVTCT